MITFGGLLEAVHTFGFGLFVTSIELLLLATLAYGCVCLCWLLDI